MTSAAAVALERLHRFNGWFEPRVDATRTVHDEVRGVRVTGYLSDESGWGAAGRGYVHALRHLEVPLRVHDVSSLTTNRSEDHSLGVTSTAENTTVNLVCVDAGQHFALLSEVGESFFEGHYNIGAWAWELPRFPERWYNRFAYYDEIWVGTSFIANALGPIAPVPVVRMPPVVCATPGSREAGRRRLNVDERTFLFTFVFDVHSHLPRKNPHAVIAAFRRAFPQPGAARLVLKSVNAGADADGYAELRALADGASIDFYDEYWPSQHVYDLMAACDAYVSLHRSEGTGLTIAEAMSCGKPVIATDWSGNTDFADSSNSFPVAYELAEVTRNVGPYEAGETWAEPDIDHAAWLMRQVVREPEMAARRGEAARRRMQRDYSEEAVAALVRHRLDAIGGRERLPSLRSTMSAFVDGYRDLVADVRRVVSAHVPPGAVVSVVSRGDADLLEVAPACGWHFPEARPGVYAGYHPADSEAAVVQLESARARGASFLLFPGTSLWWLEHYDGLRDHLENHYRCIWRDARCVLFDLRFSGAEVTR